MGVRSSYGFLVLLLAAFGPSIGAQEVDARRIEEIRQTPVGRKVTVGAVITDVQPCAAPGNKHFSCAAVRNGHFRDVILVDGKIPRQRLLEWASTSAAVEFSGRVEMRPTVEKIKTISLVADAVREKPAHVPPPVPLNPQWKRIDRPAILRHSLFYDTNSLEKSGGEVSAWLLGDLTDPEEVAGGMSMSATYWLRISCDGSRAAFRRTVHFQQHLASGAVRATSDAELPIDLNPNLSSKEQLFGAYGVVALKRLCN